MDAQKLAFVTLASALVGVVIGAFLAQTSFAPAASTSDFTKTVFLTGYVDQTKSVTEEVLLCAATGYILPDAEEAFGAEVTVTSGNSTYTTVSITSVSTAGTGIEGMATYASSTNAMQPPGSAFTSTSDDLACEPSSCWTVTNCTYLG